MFDYIIDAFVENISSPTKKYKTVGWFKCKCCGIKDWSINKRKSRDGKIICIPCHKKDV